MDQVLANETIPFSLKLLGPSQLAKSFHTIIEVV